MLIITNVFTFSSTLPVWVQGIPWQLSKQISKLFFQMSAQVYSVLGQTKRRRKGFLHCKSIALSSRLSLTYGGNDNYSYSWKQRTSWQFSKQINKSSFQLSVQVYSLLGIDLSSKLSLTYGGNDSYSYSWEQGTSGQFSKQISKPSFQLGVQVYSLLGQTEGERKTFFLGVCVGGGGPRREETF